MKKGVQKQALPHITKGAYSLIFKGLTVVLYSGVNRKGHEVHQSYPFTWVHSLRLSDAMLLFPHYLFSVLRVDLSTF